MAFVQSPNAEDAVSTDLLAPIEELVRNGKPYYAGVLARRLGQGLAAEGRYMEAIQSLKRSAELLQGDDSALLTTRQLIARTYSNANMAKKAEQEWLSILEEYGSDSDYDRTVRRRNWFGLGEHFLKSGYLDRAEIAYRNVVEVMEIAENFDFYSEGSLNRLIQLYEGKKSFSKATDMAKLLVQGIEHVNNKTKGEEKEKLLESLATLVRLARISDRDQEAEIASRRIVEVQAEFNPDKRI